jgi:hypothetical protein
MAEQVVNREIKTVDIVDFSMQDKPIKVMDAFNSIMSDKIVNSLVGKKQEISAQMFSDKIIDREVGIVEPPVETTETQ